MRDFSFVAMAVAVWMAIVGVCCAAVARYPAEPGRIAVAVDRLGTRFVWFGVLCALVRAIVVLGGRLL